jgi:UDP-N-acetylglucosamine 4,6-dehydratase
MEYSTFFINRQIEIDAIREVDIFREFRCIEILGSCGMSSYDELQGKTILITGGTGSFGRSFAKRILLEGNPAKVIIFSRDEWKQWDMKGSEPVYSDPRIRYFMGDVRDKPRLMRAFQGVDVVIHAAALKHVPAAEYNPSEFVKTNVVGAMNIIDAAIDCGVKKVIALSTDKAVNPVNLYGATKLCSDKLFVGGNVYVGSKGFPHFSIVRYGNVIGSRGSIIPFWKKLVSEGAKELPVTDSRMTRFWITMDQAIDFVVNRLSCMRGGEIFVPKIPSMNIMDLADALAPHLPKKICGIREGEKLHEMMISSEDSRHTIEHADYYEIRPELVGMDARHRDLPIGIDRGKPLEDGFVYASNTNSEWLKVEDLAQFVK